MKAKKAMGKAVIVLLVLCFCAHAELIEIGFSGLVDSVDDPCNLLQNGVQQGATITGSYSYNSQTPDSTPELEWNGLYQHTTTPYGMSLTIGELTFQTDETNVDFVVWIKNNFNNTEDGYRVTSYNNLPLNDLHIERLSWFLNDYSGDAISSIELPATPPDLSVWQSNLLLIDGYRGSDFFEFSGHVTDVWLIPEPCTLFIFGLGGLLLRKRS
jgi:hypothetical protein